MFQDTWIFFLSNRYFSVRILTTTKRQVKVLFSRNAVFFPHFYRGVIYCVLFLIKLTRCFKHIFIGYFTVGERLLTRCARSFVLHNLSIKIVRAHQP